MPAVPLLTRAATSALAEWAVQKGWSETEHPRDLVGRFREILGDPEADLAHNPSPTGRHWLFVTSKHSGRPVGTMVWSEKHVESVTVEPAYQRKGIATALWQSAKALAEQGKAPPPLHSRDQTKQGKAWARRVGKAWNETAHPRIPTHHRYGGRWTKRGGGLPSDLGDEIHASGGATVDPRSSSYIIHGVVVATGLNSRLVDAGRFNSDPAWARQQVFDYLNQNKSAIDANPDHHLGFWHDTEHNEVAFDVVEVTDRANAIKLGRERGEQAVWDLDLNEPIDTGGTGGREGLTVAKVRARRADRGQGASGRHDGRRALGAGSGDRGEGQRSSSEAPSADVLVARRAALSALTNYTVQKARYDEAKHPRNPHTGEWVGLSHPSAPRAPKQVNETRYEKYVAAVADHVHPDGKDDVLDAGENTLHDQSALLGRGWDEWTPKQWKSALASFQGQADDIGGRVQKAKRGPSHVRTEPGVKRFHEPIGALITRHLLPKRPRHKGGKDTSAPRFTAHSDAKITPVAPNTKTQDTNLSKWMANHEITQESLIANTDRLFTEAGPRGIDYGLPWYYTAHAHAQDIAAKYDVPVPTAAAVIARLSPRNTWYVPGELSKNNIDMHEAGRGNLASADKVFAAIANLNPDGHIQITDEQFTKAREKLGSSKNLIPEERRSAVVGDVRYGDLTPSELALFDPTFQTDALSANAAPAVQLAFGEVTSDAGLGDAGKIRSFYNNIVSPGDSMDVTIDTHQTRAMMASIDFPEQAYSLIAKVGPRYAFFADAVRAVAAKHSTPEHQILPHQVQAVIWEQWRLDNPPAVRAAATAKLLQLPPHTKISKKTGKPVLDDNGNPIQVVDYRVGTVTYELDTAKLKSALKTAQQEAAAP
jgi:GNAT superfamily N-acetyltransferase